MAVISANIGLPGMGAGSFMWGFIEMGWRQLYVGLQWYWV